MAEDHEHDARNTKSREIHQFNEIFINERTVGEGGVQILQGEIFRIEFIYLLLIFLVLIVYRNILTYIYIILCLYL